MPEILVIRSRSAPF